MNFLTNILLVACCAPSASAIGGRNATEYGERSMLRSRNGFNEDELAESMIGNVDVDEIADIAQEKELLRDESIPLVRV